MHYQSGRDLRVVSAADGAIASHFALRRQRNQAACVAQSRAESAAIARHFQAKPPWPASRMN